MNKYRMIAALTGVLFLVLIWHSYFKPTTKSSTKYNNSPAEFNASMSKWRDGKVTFNGSLHGLVVKSKAVGSDTLTGNWSDGKESAILNSTSSLNGFVVESKRNWQKGTFCYDFLVDTYQLPVPVCSTPTNSSPTSINCLGTPYSELMGTCILDNVFISPHLFGKISDPNYASEPIMALIGDRETQCQKPSLKSLKHHVEGNDITLQIIEKVTKEDPRNSSVCEKWIGEDVFLFDAQKTHIYFRFLAYFNIHKHLQDFNNNSPHGIRLISIPGGDNLHFSEFDQLFPEVKVDIMNNLEDVKTCFKKVIIIPGGYHSIPFRCRMSSVTQHKCLACNGQGLTGTQMISFRKRVLKACSVTDQLSKNWTQNYVPSIVFVSRKPYIRHEKDKLGDFLRVLSNGEELVSGLKKELNCTVYSVHMEELELCDQVRIVHDADIYLGVHGAGLVHLWWLQDDALIYELVPTNQMSNSAFSTLSALSGRKYKSLIIGSGNRIVHVNVAEVIKDLKKYLSSKLKLKK